MKNSLFLVLCLLSNVYSAENWDVKKLNFRIIDAEIHKMTNQIVMVSDSPSNALISYNPQSDELKTFNLPLHPTCVSVNHNEQEAVAGHDAYITIVHLDDPSQTQTSDVPLIVSDIIFAPNQNIYLIPLRDQWESLRCFDIRNGTITDHEAGSITAGSIGKLHPNGKWIYLADRGVSPSDIEKFDISNGNAIALGDSPYHGDYPMCGDLWFSEDGKRIVTKCGYAFHSSDIKSKDMTYNGRINSNILQLSHEISDKTFVIIPSDRTNTIQLYSDDYLTFQTSFDLPIADFEQMNGLFVFHNPKGDGHYVIGNNSKGYFLASRNINYNQTKINTIARINKYKSTQRLSSKNLEYYSINGRKVNSFSKNIQIVIDRKHHRKVVLIARNVP